MVSLGMNIIKSGLGFIIVKKNSIFSIMKTLFISLIATLLFSLNTYGQKLIKSPYDARMEARAIANLHLTLDSVIKKERIITWKPYNRIKFTMKTRLNSNVLQKIDINDGMNNLFSDLDSDDYWSIGSYDIRCKIYLTKKVRFLGRMVITGVNTQTYFYSTGLIVKF